MESASLVYGMPEVGEKQKTNHTTQKSLAKLGFFAGTIYVLASVALLILMLTKLANDMGDGMELADVICADKRNTAAILAFWSSDRFTFDNAPFAKQLGIMLNTIFRMNPLSITMGWGSFTFPAVKTIDTIWNLIISRIGQMIFAFFTGKIITAWLVMKMESETVPYQIVRETALSRGHSLVILWYLFDMKRCSKLWKRHKLQLLGFAVCLLFVIVYPVLTDAMTGYVPRRTMYLRGINGDVLVAHQKRDDDRVLTIGYSIDNGHLLNLSDPTYMWSNGDNMSGFLELGSSPKLTTFEGIALNPEMKRLYSNCTESCDIFHWPDGDNTTLPDGELLRIRFVENFDLTTEPFYIIDGNLVTFYEMLSDYTVCLSEDAYLWGFSWHFLSLWALLNVIQALILWATWYRLRQHSGMRQSYGVHRAMIDLADMSRDVIGEDVHFMTDKDIKNALDRSKAGLKTG